MNNNHVIVTELPLLIEKIRKRPGVWGIHKNIYSLLGFLQAYSLVGGTYDKNKFTKYDSFISDFYEYIKKKLSYIQEKYPPENPLRQYLYHEFLILASDNDTEKAFDLFFELFDKFKKEKGIE